MSRDEDNRQANVCFGQFGLKLYPADTRKAHIENKAARHVRLMAGQKLGGGAKRRHLETDRAKQRRERASDVSIIVNYKDLLLIYWRRLRDSWHGRGSLYFAPTLLVHF